MVWTEWKNARFSSWRYETSSIYKLHGEYSQTSHLRQRLRLRQQFDLLSFKVRRWARVWWLVDLTRLYHRISFLFSATKPESGDGPNIRREEDLRFSRVLSCGGGKWRGGTREGGRASIPNSGRFYPYPLVSPSYFELEAEGPLFKSHMPSSALTADDKVPLFCFVPFCSTARIISGASKHTFSLNWVATQNMALRLIPWFDYYHVSLSAIILYCSQSIFVSRTFFDHKAVHYDCRRVQILSYTLSEATVIQSLLNVFFLL